MAITINSTRENETDKTVFFSIDYDGTKKWHGDIPKDADPQEWFDANEDKIKCGILRKQYPGADVPALEGKTELDAPRQLLESFEAWVSGGCKNAAIESVVVTPAVEAQDAVMGTRQKMVEREVEEEVSKTEVVEIDGKFVQKTTTETVTKTVSEPQVEKHKLYNEAGKEIGEHEVAVMEEYEITPAIEAVEEATETVVVRAETVVDKIEWKDTAE